MDIEGKNFFSWNCFKDSEAQAKFKKLALNYIMKNYMNINSDKHFLADSFDATYIIKVILLVNLWLMIIF